MDRNWSTFSDNSNGENESEPIAESFKCKTLCIFCATEVPSAFVIERGKLKRIKEEMELNSFGCEDVILAKQLRVINIMRNILDISEETCSSLVRHFDGQYRPEFWMKVCSSCNVLVEEFNSTRREVARLERLAKKLKQKLKGFISTSNQGKELDDDSLVWREIREEALAGFEQTIQEPQDIEKKLGVDIPMTVEVEPEFRVKTEVEEEPSSLASLVRQPTAKAKVGNDKKIGIGKTRASEKPLATAENGESEGNSDVTAMEHDNGTTAVEVEKKATNPASKGNEDGSPENNNGFPVKVLEKDCGEFARKRLTQRQICKFRMGRCIESSHGAETSLLFYQVAHSNILHRSGLGYSHSSSVDKDQRSK